MRTPVHPAHFVDPRDQNRALWEQLDPPEGCRAQIVAGTLIVALPSSVKHSVVASRLSRLIILNKPAEFGVHQTVAVDIGATGDIYVPDVLVYPRTKFPTEGYTAPAQHTLLAVEITSSSSADRDRTQKLWGYAHACVPLYLLVDPHAADGPHVTLYSRPESGVYQTLLRVPYGEIIELPAPFEMKIDTGRFHR